MKNKGALFANDVNPKRMFSLSGNLQRLGVENAVVTNMDGRAYPSMAKGRFHRVLLDAPCSGMGVISRDPSIKAHRTYKEILRESHIQKQLLLAAIDCLEAAAPPRLPGVLVYSTCSITVEENEAVLDYALHKRYVRLVETELPVGVPGFTRHKRARFHPSLAKCRRVYPHTHNMDGFFVAKLVKFANGARTASSEPKEEESQGERKSVKREKKQREKQEAEQEKAEKTVTRQKPKKGRKEENP